MKRRLTILALAALLATTAAADGLERDAERRVYLLGVDHAPIGDDAAGLLAELSLAVDPADRWALTEYVRESGARADGTIPLSADIEYWNPAEDPYNFGLIRIQDIDQSIITLPGMGSQTFVSVSLLWVQVGHDLSTRFSVDKLPELRFSVSEYTVQERVSERPLSDAQRSALRREVFDTAMVNLLRKVDREYRRNLRRSAAELRYVTVTTPVVIERARRDLAELYGNAGGATTDQVTRLLQSFLEDELMERFQDDERFDTIALLPNVEVLDSIRTEWPSFAARVAARSRYSANLEAIGLKPPVVRQVVPLCEVQAAAARSAVPGLEVRSNLTRLAYDAEPFPGVRLHTLTAFAASDIKLPLTAADAMQVSAAPLPPLHGRGDLKLRQSDQVSIEGFLRAQLVPLALLEAAEDLGDALAGRLLVALSELPLPTHPSLMRKCS